MSRFRVVEKYCQNGWEDIASSLDPGITEFIEASVAAMDYATCHAKVSKEATMLGRTVLSPIIMNKHLEGRFHERGYRRYREITHNTADVALSRRLRDADDQQRAELIRSTNCEVFTGFQEYDFLANGNVFEVQFAKYAFAISDIEKTVELVERGIAKTAAVIMPMKSMQGRMSSGPAYYENVLRSFIARRLDERITVPIALLGIGVVE